MDSIRIPLNRIKINTRQMENLSWRRLLGHRRELKRAIASCVESNPDLRSLLAERGRLEINQVSVGIVEQRDEIPFCQQGFGTSEDDWVVNQSTTISISAFKYEGRLYPIKPIVISCSTTLAGIDLPKE